MDSPRIHFTRLEKDWRYGTKSLVDAQDVSDIDIVETLQKSVFINEHLYNPKLVKVKTKSIGTETVDPVDLSTIETNIRSIPKGKGSNEIAKNILSILLHKEFRRGSMKLIEPFLDLFIYQIEQFVESNEAIQIILPTLPAKGQNRARNDHEIDDVSLGEILFLAQLRDIAMSVKEIYKPGLKIIVVTDGIIYADMFRYNDTARAILYRNRCMELRDKMDLRESVDIVDMDWVLQGEPRFGWTKEFIHERLIYLWKTDQKAKKHLDSLMRGMIFNMPTPGNSFEKAIESINTPFEKLPETFKKKLKFTTLRYAAGLIALNQLSILKRAFPRALRATVHPKNSAQIGLHLVNSSSTVFPYHGVVLVSNKKLQETQSLRKASKIVSLYDLYQLNKPITKFVETSKNTSLYYLLKN